MFRKLCSLTLIFLITILCSSPLGAQQNYTIYQKKAILGQLINAFQLCGPQSAYQILGPAVFQAVAMQTQGRGCYTYLLMLGQVLTINKTDSQAYPAGPVDGFSVKHQNGMSYWQMGISNITGKVEWLTVSQLKVPVPPAIKATDDDDDSTNKDDKNNDITGQNTKKSQKVDDNAGCQLYPAMCEDK